MNTKVDEKILNAALKWIQPSIKGRSISETGISFRMEKAKEQYDIARKIIFNEKEMIDCVNDFLDEIGINIIKNPKYPLKECKTRRISYSKIREEYKNKKDDIIWIKLSTTKNKKTKIISVIGTSEDIFFTEYTKKNTVSGKINLKLGLEWIEDYVYIFPLVNIPFYLTRSDIESGIGNYLIYKGFPILDFYSHNY